MKIANVNNFFINAIFLFTFTQVCLSFIPYGIYFVLLITCIMGSCFFLKKMKVEKQFFLLIVIFISPVFLSSTVGIIFSLIYEPKFDYSQLSVLGRISNLILIVISMVFISSYSFKKNYNEEQYLKQMRFYWFGCFILLLTALWQFLDKYVNIVSFPFETRTNVHGTTNIYAFSGRLTGIAEEPSYLTPFIIDFFIFTFVAIKNKIIRYLMLIFALFILIFTFSPSGYISFCTSFIFASIAVFKNKITIKKIIFFSFCIFLLICFSYVMADYLYNLEYIFDRLDSADQSARVETIIKAVDLVFDSHFMTILFGHGVKSFALLQQIVTFSSGNTFFVTSNNLFVDNLWESGLVGILLYLTGFFFVYRMILKCAYSSKQKFIVWFIFFNWVLTSLYRADYANLHFFVLVYFMVILSKFEFKLE